VQRQRGGELAVEPVVGGEQAAAARGPRQGPGLGLDLGVVLERRAAASTRSTSARLPCPSRSQTGPIAAQTRRRASCWSSPERSSASTASRIDAAPRSPSPEMIWAIPSAIRAKNLVRSPAPGGTSPAARSAARRMVVASPA
jgi:hypothetical protein